MEDASQNEALDLLEVLQDESNAQMFTSIQDKQLRHGWLVRKINAKNGN
jgi:hypothetical protein